jgi:single-strand DNA-binding protein
MIEVILIGRLGRDAELKEFDGGKKVCNFTVAVDQGTGDNKTTLWIDCAKWGEKQGVAQYLKKGTQVFVKGEPTVRTWEGQNGHGAGLSVRVSSLELLGGGGQSQGQSQQPQQQQQATAQQPAPAAPQGVQDNLPF